MSPSEFLSLLVKTPSLSKAEDEVANLVVNVVKSWGIEPKRLGNNVWFEIDGQRRDMGETAMLRTDGWRGDMGGTPLLRGPVLLLNSHIDTVKVCDGWTVDPFGGEWIDNRLIGLGANDAGGCVTSILFAAKRFIGRAFNGKILVAITAEEENGGPDGIAAFLKAYEGPIDAGIVGEPTSLKACNAQRGMLLLRCIASGVSGHVAHSHVGENAVHKAARDIVRLQEMRFEPHPLLGETRAQVTTIEGGLLRNQIPDRCEFFVDLRTTPNLDHDELGELIRKELETEVIIHSERYQPKDTSADKAIVKAALQASPHKEPVGSATVSDWAFLGDIPAVKVGPGDTLRSHTPDEYLLREELDAGIEFYDRTIAAYFELAKET